jgi:RimJ/RimL family protein N-acetyltransferase
MQSFPDLQTERLRLRAFTAADIPAFVAYRADSEVARYQDWDDYTRQDGEAFFRKQTGEFGQPGAWYQVAIADRESNGLLGDLALHFLADDHRQIELGFTLARASQGRGVAAEAVRCMLDHMFGEGGMHRVHATIDTRNTAAIKLVGRLGFRQEAHLVENVFFKGAWGDEFVFALLAREWSSSRA